MVLKTAIQTTSEVPVLLTASTATWLRRLNCPRAARARMMVSPTVPAEDVRPVESGQRVERVPNTPSAIPKPSVL